MTAVSDRLNLFGIGRRREWPALKINIKLTEEQRGVLAAGCTVALTTGLCMILLPYLKHRNLCMLYLLAVVYVSSKYDWFPSILTAVLSLFAYNYFVDPPQFSLYTLDPQNLITFGVVMFVSMVMSRRTLLIRRLAGNLEEQVRVRTAELERANAQLSLEIASRRMNELVQQQMLNQLASRNATLEHFAKLTVHDLREPLRTVIGYGKLLRSRHGPCLEQPVLEFLERFDGGVERMERLIDGIGELARLNHPSAHEVVSASAFVEEALLNLTEQIRGKNAQVVVGEGIAAHSVFCDCKQIVHLFQNIVSNALKFCLEQPQVLIDCVPQEQFLLFSISDNGIGIEEEYQGRLFQLFQRLHTRREFPGIGLGLVLCKKIVENHGGKIWVESTGSANNTSGTTFYFTLPFKGD